MRRFKNLKYIQGGMHDTSYDTITMVSLMLVETNKDITYNLVSKLLKSVLILPVANC